MGGQVNNPFGDLKLSVPTKLQGLLGNEFSINDIADQFGAGGLFGNLPITVDTDVAPKLNPEQNVLHEYASVTYRITLGAQDIKDHQEVAGEGFTSGRPKITTMMMGSGGGHEVDGVTRDPIFKEDFYIEDLKMTTIIGSNAQGNGSNAVNLTFNIMEPYAVSLIERLLALANKLGYENYIEIPYVFKIEFIGYNDAGDMIGVIPQTTKYIPFRLTYMQFQVSGKGSAYKCTAIPMNHMTFNQTVTAIPEPVVVSAGSIGDFFNSKDTGESGNNTTAGLVETVNAYHSKLANDSLQGSKARNAADKIKIIIHESIAAHFLTVANVSNVGMVKEGFRNQFMETEKPQYGFLPGTSITAIIETMIKNSTYWTLQVRANDRIKAANAETDRHGNRRTPQKEIPAVMPKITASYKMLEYDEKANRHAYEATYIVEPYEVRAVQLVGRSEIENIAKEYDYLFTGKNQDILDLAIKFDLAFYNSVTANTENAAEGTPRGTNKTANGSDSGDGPINAGDDINKPVVETMPNDVTENVGTASKEDIAKLKASALEKSIMQSSAGDMITLDMTILGDPAFIKQDDILYRSDGDNSNAFTDNGSIKQDSGDMYIRLRFKTFDDIDHNTGLRVEDRQIPDSTFTRKSTFDGFYRIMMIDNVFNEGRFTQNLVVVRVYVQETDKPASDLKSLASSLVSFPSNLKDQAIAGVTSASSDAINSATLTAAAQVDEAQAQARNVFATQEQIAEDLITNLTSKPDAASIVAITTAAPGRGRLTDTDGSF